MIDFKRRISITKVTLTSIDIDNFESKRNERNLFSKTFKLYWSKLTHHVSSIYFKYITPSVAIFLILFLFYGIIKILTQNKPPFETLSVLGSFIGGIAAVFAVTLAIKEYFIFKAYRSIDEYRKFIIEKLRPLPKDLTTDYSLLRACYTTALDEKYEVKDSARDRLIDKLDSMSEKYKQVRNDLYLDFNDISYVNQWITIKVSTDFYELINLLSEYEKAINAVNKYYCLGNKDGFENNSFISEFSDEKSSSKPPSIDKLLKLIDKIDETKIL